ncbi:MAG TPA: saccharopine dehydrogenase C-terminal domain-containing protein [Ignavibacteriaceae bacterium]|nr:saccharopine dehydrogenase C-terminal domain-containing protein [Ignavibacteriaceae bacterium]
MKNILVLGAGMVGSAIVKDLAQDFEVNVIDRDDKNLGQFSNYSSVNAKSGDVSNFEFLLKESGDADLIICAVPGSIGFETLERIIRCGKNVVDISFFDKDPFELDKLAKENNITAVVDCGVAPGMSNLILGYQNSKMDIESFHCMVGGLPFKKIWPFHYKAPFSPADVLEEYTRPARLRVNGEVIVKPALSDVEIVEFKNAGELESFNTDGLRTLLTTMKIPNMTEKTLRYPGHAEYMKVLRETGFFNKDEIDIEGQKVSPISLTSKLLFPIWKLGKSEPEFTALKLIISGKENGISKKYTYELFDEYDKETDISSMARTTGYTCTATARLILNGKFNRKGICPPEFVGAEPGCYEFVLSELNKRNVVYNIL